MRKEGKYNLTFNSAISILCQIMSAKHPILTYMNLLRINVSAISIILLIIVQLDLTPMLKLFGSSQNIVCIQI